MDICLWDLRKKELVCLQDGSKLGYVDDVLIDMDTKAVKALIVRGRLRFFFFFWREPDLLIPWEEIGVIGSDALLIKEVPCEQRFFEHRRELM